MKVEIPNADLGAIKDAIMTLEGGQRHGEVFATGIDGKQQFQQRVTNGVSENVPVVLVKYDGSHKKFAFKEEGKVRYNLGKSLKVIETQIRAVDQKRNEKVEAGWEAQNKDEKLKGVDRIVGEYFLAYQKDLNKLMAEKVELETHPVLLSQINIDVNAIQANVFSALIDVVIFDDSKGQHAEKVEKTPA